MECIPFALLAHTAQHLTQLMNCFSFIVLQVTLKLYESFHATQQTPTLQAEE